MAPFVGIGDFMDEGAQESGGAAGDLFDREGLSTYIQDTLNVSHIRQGDYLWINTQMATGASADAHGLLVVGWGEIQTCEAALQLSPASLTLYSTPSNAPSNLPLVPYVADFNRLQRPSARPFYCTLFQDPTNLPQPGEQLENFFGGDHSWYFYAMPDQIVVNIDQIYTLYNWEWNEESGNE
jgi:hypothetical protein